jgi:hypothetical protein
MTKKQIRDDAGKFSTKSGSGGLKTQKELNWKRILPIVILIAFVGGWLVSSSFAASNTQYSDENNEPKPGSDEEKLKESTKALTLGNVLQAPLDKDSIKKDIENASFNEHYGLNPEGVTKRWPKYYKCQIAGYLFNSKVKKSFSKDMALQNNVMWYKQDLADGIIQPITLQDAKNCGQEPDIFYRCIYYSRKLIALNDKFSKAYFDKHKPSEKDLSSGKIKMSDMIPKKELRDYSRIEGATMACKNDDFSQNKSTSSAPHEL